MQRKRTRVKPLPSIDTFLAFNPLPEKLAHLEPIIRRLPDTEALLNTVVGCARAGFSDDQISTALHRVAEHAAQPTKRCACCLAWREGGATFALTDDGEIQMLTACHACARLIAAGRVTPTMRKNLRAYGFGGAR